MLWPVVLLVSVAVFVSVVVFMSVAVFMSAAIFMFDALLVSVMHFVQYYCLLYSMRALRSLYPLRFLCCNVWGLLYSKAVAPLKAVTLPSQRFFLYYHVFIGQLYAVLLLSAVMGRYALL